MVLVCVCISVSYSCNHSDFHLALFRKKNSSFSSFSYARPNSANWICAGFSKQWQAHRIRLLFCVSHREYVYSYLNLTNCRISMRLLFSSSSTNDTQVHIRTFRMSPIFSLSVLSLLYSFFSILIRFESIFSWIFEVFVCFDLFCTIFV